MQAKASSPSWELIFAPATGGQRASCGPTRRATGRQSVRRSGNDRHLGVVVPEDAAILIFAIVEADFVAVGLPEGFSVPQLRCKRRSKSAAGGGPIVRHLGAVSRS